MIILLKYFELKSFSWIAIAAFLVESSSAFLAWWSSKADDNGMIIEGLAAAVISNNVEDPDLLITKWDNS